MLVRTEDNGKIGIKTDQNIFPPHSDIETTELTVNHKLFHVYFDLDKHKSNCTKTSYVFLRLRNSDVATDIVIEDDLPTIIDCLTA